MARHAVAGVAPPTSTSPTTTPSGDSRCTTTARLFEKISLEGFQAGLSWLTILRKRENFRRAFADFDIETVARFTPATSSGC